MNNCTKLFFTVISILLLLNSCSIEKRRYMSGFHTEWHHGNNKSTAQHENSYKIQEPDSAKEKELYSEKTCVSEVDNNQNQPTLEDEKLNTKNENKEFTASNDVPKKTADEHEQELTASNNHDDNLILTLSKKISLLQIDKGLKENTDREKNKIANGRTAGTMGVLAWVLVLAAVISLLIPHPYLPAFVFLAFLSYIFGIIAFVVGILSIKDSSKGDGLVGSILGIVLGSFFVSGILLIMIALVLSLI